MFIDTHAHLNFRAFNKDFTETILRAKKANIKGIINIGSDYDTSKKALEIAQKNTGVYAAVGLHPIHIIDRVYKKDLFAKLAKNSKVLAIGEVGLDYSKEEPASQKKKLQKEIFIDFLNIARELNKPVIIHSRDSLDDILKILNIYQQPGVLHCFSGDWRQAQIVLNLGFYISFTGSITYNLSKKTAEVIQKTSLNQLLIETDCPYMTPLKYRKKEEHIRNEPAYVVEVAKKIAELKKIPLNIIERETAKNAIELFNLKELK